MIATMTVCKPRISNFYILLTVHPNSLFFLITNLIHKFFILIHLLCSFTCTQVTRGLQSFCNMCAEQSLKESDGTRCCINTICPPEDKHNSV